MFMHSHDSTVVHSLCMVLEKDWSHGYVCSCIFMHSHVRLSIAMHGGRRLGCMVMYAEVCSCIVMYSCI